MSSIMGLEILSSDLKYLDGLLDDILDGQKPLLDPENSNEKHIIDFLHALYPEDFDHALDRSLDTRPEGYYITPNQVIAGEDKLVSEVNTKVHPLHENLHKVNHAIAGRASKIQLRNFVVAGADIHFRDRRDYEDAFERSPNLLLHAKGDVVSLSQSVKVLRGVIDGTDQSDRALLIDNTTGRFSPILDLLGLHFEEAIDSLNETFEEHSRNIRIAVAEGKNTVIGRMKAIAYDPETKLQPLPQVIPQISFQATSSQEKMDDVRRALQAQRSALSVQDAKVIGGPSEHDPEFQFTFAGNDYAKGLLTIEDKQKNPHVTEVLNSMGLDRGETGILFYDGGESYAERGLRDTSVMEPYLNESHPLAEFPGAETKPVSSSVGTNADFYKVIQEGLEEIKAKEGREVDTRILDNCVVIYMPLKQEDMDNPRYFSFKATTVQELEFNPDPMIAVNSINDEFKTQRHSQKPLGRVETLAELEEEGDLWMLQQLAISKAIRGFSDAVRMPKHKIDLEAEFNKVKDVVVHCPHPLPQESENVIRAELEEQGLQLSMRQKQVKSIAQVRDMVARSDALLFPNVAIGKDENFWTNRVFMPASAVVEKQLSGTQIPIAFLHDGNEPTEFEQIANHYKRANMVAQDVRHLYRGADKVKKNADYIKESLLNREEFGDFTQKFRIALPKRKDAVVFLESASSTHPVDLQNSYELAVNCGLNGFDNVSGFGMSGPMGMVSWAGMQLRHEGWTDHVVMGAQDPNAMKTEGAPHEAMNKIMGSEYGIVSPDIFERMWQMLQMDELQKDSTMTTTAVAQGCGVGGLQEISFIMALKELGVPGAERISLIIENAQRELPSGTLGPHDELLDIMEQRGDLGAKKNGVYASSDPEETMAVLGVIKNRKIIYVPIENPVKTMHPFEEVKNPLYGWLMDRGDWESDVKNISQALEDSERSMTLAQDLRND